ncbi:MAG: serine hydrolase [Bradyrhizobium sp.]|nr:serine hydrolase [Bradyrhizobium sp.]
MSNDLKVRADAVLQKVTANGNDVPGVVAVVTDREADIYQGAAGKRMLGGEQDMTLDTVFGIFSTTKAVTGTAVLQLVEEGKLHLDAPAKTYVPDIGKLQVLEGFGSDGKPQLRAPKRDITTRMLMLHTAGFGYEFFSDAYHRLVGECDVPSIITATYATLQRPILFEPGSTWEYGIGMDWAGQIVESITGRRLGEVFQSRIFEPLGMEDTAFSMTPSMRSRLAAIHMRDNSGTLSPAPDFILPQQPEVHMGGHGLYSTATDYTKFLRMWLNDGQGVQGRVLKPETIRMAEANQLGEMKISKSCSADPILTNDLELFPGSPKSWGLSFMINDENAPTGRPAGSLSWVGLANLYYWIDRRHGIAGFWATQVLPLADPPNFEANFAFETAVYQSISQSN